MSEDEATRLNAAQLASPSYRLAALDQDFLLGDSMRSVRFLLEFAKADEALRAWGVRSTIVVFGSARIGESGAGQHGRWYAEARAFGRLASERGGALRDAPGQPRDNVIATGGGPVQPRPRRHPLHFWAAGRSAEHLPSFRGGPMARSAFRSGVSHGRGSSACARKSLNRKSRS